jgi:AAA ATPase domain
VTCHPRTRRSSPTSAAGVGNAVLLSGEAGAGKTRLAEEGAALADAAQISVAWVSCWASTAAPLSVWLDLVAAVDVAHASPHRDPDRDELDPELARAALVRQLVAEMREALAGRSTLLVVDDLQWCDPLSLRAIDVLISSLRTLPVGLVAKSRDDDEPALLLSEFAGAGRRLIVPPLTSEELAALGLELTGQPLSPARLNRLAQRSGGNVLYARELLPAATMTCPCQRTAGSGLGQLPCPAAASPRCHRHVNRCSRRRVSSGDDLAWTHWPRPPPWTSPCSSGWWMKRSTTGSSIRPESAPGSSPIR